MEYKTYSVKYVKALERATGLFILLTGMIAPVLSYQLVGKPVGAPTGIEEPASDPLAERAKIEARIEALLQAKRVSEARAFVKKVNPSLSWTTVEKIVKLEQKYAAKYDVPLELGLAVTLQESRFRPEVVSYTGCCFGLKQINFKAHKEDYSIASHSTLFKKEQNIAIGYKMLADHKKRYGSWDGALRRYYGSTKPEQNLWYAREVQQKAKMIRGILG